MNNDPTSLDRLHDVIAPPATPWWPPAPAWYWVIGALILGALVLLVRGILHWLHNRYRHEALAELARQEGALADEQQRCAALSALAELLKRTAITAWPREVAASLTGTAWLSFLDRTARTTGFGQGPGQWIERASYDPENARALDETQAREIAALARYWITHHRVETINREAAP